MTWQDKALKAGLVDDPRPKRRVQRLDDLWLDGLTDLLTEAPGCSILDVGCNRGHALYEFARAGAALVHGCDIFGPGMMAARQWFAEVHVEHQFEPVDLSKGPASLNVFGTRRYDIVLMMGVRHKIMRVMPGDLLSSLMQNIGKRAIKTFAWNGYPEELPQLDLDMRMAGLERAHTSKAEHYPSVAIWRRP